MEIELTFLGMPNYMINKYNSNNNHRVRNLSKRHACICNIRNEACLRSGSE